MSPLWKKVAALAFLTFLALWVVALIGGFALPLPREPAYPVSNSNVQQIRQGDGAQGFLFSHPQPADKIERLFTADAAFA